MASTSLDLSQIRTDALSSGATFRTLIGLGSSDSPTYKGIVLATGTITASTPAIDITQTWNNNSVGFTGFKFNATDTASNSFSLIADWQIGGVQRFAVSKLGYVSTNRIGAIGSGNNIIFESNNTQIGDGGTASLYVSNTFNVAQLTSTVAFGWCSGGSSATSLDLILRRDAAGILAQRNAGNAQTFRLYRTYSDGSNYAFTAAKQDATTGYILDSVNLGSPAEPTNLLDLQLNGVSRFKITKAGGLILYGGNAGGGVGTVFYVYGNGDNAGFPYTDYYTSVIGGLTGPAIAYRGASTEGVISYNFFARERFVFSGQTTALGYYWPSQASSTSIANNSGTISFYTTATGTTLAPVAASNATLSTGTITASTPAIDISQTWNNNAVNFSAIRGVITNTASGSASDVINISVNGNQAFRVDKNGFLYLSNGPGLLWNGTHVNLTGNLQTWGWLEVSDGGSSPPRLNKDGNYTLGLRNGTNQQRFNLYGTYSDGANYRRLYLDSTTAGAFTIGVEGLGTGASGNTLTVAAPTTLNSGLTVTLSGSTVLQCTSTDNMVLGKKVWVNGAGTNYYLANGTNGWALAFGSNNNANSVSFGVRSDNEFAATSSGEYVWTSLAYGASQANPTIDLRIARDAANTLALRNGTNQQRFNLYGTYDSNGTNYRRLYLDSTTAGAFTIGVEGAGTGASGNTLTVANALSLSGPLTVNSNSNSQFVGTNSKWEIDIDSPGEGGKLNYLSYNTRRLIISGRADQPFIKWWNISYPSFIGQGAGDGAGDVGFSFYQQTITASAKSGYTTVPVNFQINGNTSIADTWNSNISVTGASGNGTTATLTFSAMTTAFPVGSTIVVSSVNPSGYNGTFTVTASSTTSVSYLNATTGAYVSGGNIKQLFTALKLNVTDTSSDAGSLLADFQVSGTTVFNVSKTGALVTGPLMNSVGIKIGTSTFDAGIGSGSGGGLNRDLIIYNGGAYSAHIGFQRLVVRSDSVIGFSTSTSYTGGFPDTGFYRDAADTLAQRRSTNAQTFRLYRTASGTPGTDYERLALSSTTYSSAVYNTILCESGGTGAANINLVLSPKGTGAILAQLPDGTTTGGNARGQYAVDLQTSRSDAANVASGNYCTITGGQSNSSTGSYCFVGGGLSNGAYTEYNVACGGRSNSAYTYGAVCVGGTFNVASANQSFIGGGQQNIASAEFSIVPGGLYGVADRYGQLSHASGGFAYQGDAQKVEFVLRIKTTNATATTLMLNGSSSRLTIPSGKVFAFVAKINGIKSDGSAVAFYTRKGCIKNVGGTTTLVGNIETIGTDIEDNASTDVAITADDTNDALQINVTGITGETWRWVAVVEGVEIGYGT